MGTHDISHLIMPVLLSTIILIMQLLKIADISNERERTKRSNSLRNTSLETWSTIRSIKSQKREKSSVCMHTCEKMLWFSTSFFFTSQNPLLLMKTSHITYCTYNQCGHSGLFCPRIGMTCIRWWFSKTVKSLPVSQEDSILCHSGQDETLQVYYSKCIWN